MRFLASYTMYWLGRSVWLFMQIFDRGYPLYNRLMIWSSEIQGDGPAGPWKASNKETRP